MHYKQLTLEQRYTINVMYEQGYTRKEIAAAIGVSCSTVSRELRRNSSRRGKYDYNYAHLQTRKRRQAGSGVSRKEGWVWKAVIHFLTVEQWSPEQISGYLRSRGVRISHETIYARIRKDKAEGGTLYTHLRHRLRHRKKRSDAGVGMIPDRKGIELRPAGADGSVFGFFEMDTIVGPGNRHAILTITERSTNMLFMERLAHGKNAHQLAKAVIRILRPFRDAVVAITTDNGLEFSEHRMITEAIGAQVYFTAPYSSWQKGAVENINGLIRQYIPKGVDFDNFNNKQIREIMDKINDRPRKKLDYDTPKERFMKHFI